MVLSRLLLKMIVKDGLPFVTVEKEGFQEFLLKTRVVDDKQKIPSESYLRKFVLQDLYTYVKSKIVGVTKAMKYVNLQVDMWSDNHAGNAYIGIVTNHIDDDWKKQNLVLVTREFSHPHTAIRIKKEISDCLREYKIPQSICHAVTDSGANIKAAFKQIDLKIDRNSCLAHNINLLLRPDGCDKVVEVKKVQFETIEKILSIGKLKYLNSTRFCLLINIFEFSRGRQCIRN